MENEYPIVEGKIVFISGNRFVSVVCPICGNEHLHIGFGKKSCPATYSHYQVKHAPETKTIDRG